VRNGKHQPEQRRAADHVPRRVQQRQQQVKQRRGRAPRRNIGARAVAIDPCAHRQRHQQHAEVAEPADDAHLPRLRVRRTPHTAASPRATGR
jgi:hypothetical protein